MDVHDDHYRLWAAQHREGFNIGYPKQVPWYTTPRTGDVHQEQIAAYTYEDYDLVRKIDCLTVHLRDTEKRSLKVYWGAYPGASLVRAERLRESGLDKSNVRKQAKEAMKWIARHV